MTTDAGLPVAREAEARKVIVDIELFEQLRHLALEDNFFERSTDALLDVHGHADSRPLGIADTLSGIGLGGVSDRIHTQVDNMRSEQVEVFMEILEYFKLIAEPALRVVEEIDPQTVDPAESVVKDFLVAQDAARILALVDRFKFEQANIDDETPEDRRIKNEQRDQTIAEWDTVTKSLLSSRLTIDKRLRNKEEAELLVEIERVIISDEWLDRAEKLVNLVEVDAGIVLNPDMQKLLAMLAAFTDTGIGVDAKLLQRCGVSTDTASEMTPTYYQSIPQETFKQVQLIVDLLNSSLKSPITVQKQNNSWQATIKDFQNNQTFPR